MTFSNIGDYNWKNVPKDVSIPKEWGTIPYIDNSKQSHYTINPGFDSISDIRRREKQQLLRQASKYLIEIWDTIPKDFSNISNYRRMIVFINSFLTTIDIFSKTFQDIFVQRDRDLIVLLKGFLHTIIQYCEIVVKHYVTDFKIKIINDDYSSINIILDNFSCIEKLLVFFQENKYTSQSYPKALEQIIAQGNFDKMRRIIASIELIAKNEMLYKNSPEEKSDFSNLDI